VSLPTRLRPLAATMRGVSITVGAMAGIALLAAIDRRFGTAWTLLVGGVLIASMAALAARAARTADRELDRTLDQALAAEEVADRRRAGQHVPLLECRGIDFAYGSVQVLFDVDFSVDEGEMIALLGTNGAGKSTLLRVISGLGVPQRGAVHLDGRDITFATATDRVQRGISQVPGGKAVFGPMSVVENLRVYGYALGTDRAAVDRGIDTAFEVFPRLNERRNQTAQTLSGGEQQMLALSKALILEPRLLLIDELSLGLAPVIVSQLLDMVRTINERGTAVVLVEQSVNVALSLAQHAYYMEKGEIRFDGPTAQLLERPDVLRSVYLKGAADGLGAGA
jgi:ABC-type branched-subunit amino acid transport system ATPase component